MLCREASTLRSVLGTGINLFQSASMRRINGTLETLFLKCLYNLPFTVFYNPLFENYDFLHKSYLFFISMLQYLHNENLFRRLL